MCCIDEIAKATKIKGIDVLHATNELVERGFVKITPIPLSVANDDSSRYSTTQELFIDNSQYCKCKFLKSITSDTESSDFGYWDTCCVCGKHLDGGFHYYNHYDGEDHEEDIY